MLLVCSYYANQSGGGSSEELKPGQSHHHIIQIIIYMYYLYIVSRIYTQGNLSQHTRDPCTPLFIMVLLTMAKIHNVDAHREVNEVGLERWLSS